MVDQGLLVALLGNGDISQELGKKSGETDPALFHFREGGRPVSTLAPIRFPEKVQPLAHAVLVADAALLAVGAVDRTVGEAILAADAAGLETGFLLLQNYVAEEQVRPLLRGTTLERLPTVEASGPAVRAGLQGLSPREREGPARVVVDQAYSVKGVGTVVLGFVQGGGIAVHDPVRIYPTRKRAEIRSIQVQEEEVAEASPGEHVGLTLKNVEAQDLARGHVLAPEGSLAVAEVNETLPVELACGRFYKGAVAPGSILHLAFGMQFVPVRVRQAQALPGTQGRVDVVPQAPLALVPGEQGMLIDIDAKGPRVVGSATPKG